jgi:predicted permease
MAATLALFFMLLSAGYLSRKFTRFSDLHADVLNRFVIDVCVPATIFRLLPRLTFRGEFLWLAVLPWLMALLAYAFSRLLARPLQLDRASRTAFFLCTALGNTAFLGFPLCSALLGEASVPLAAVYDQLGSFLLLSSVAVVSVAKATGRGTPTTREIARRVFSFPPFIALLVALIPVAHPAWLDDALAKIAAALVPTAIFAVGLRLRITPPKQVGALLVGLLLKLLIMPALALGIVSVLGLSADVRAVAVLETAMPSMITAAALAMAAGLAPELSAAWVGWGIVLSLFTVPIWAAFLRP